jgi:type IV pilus assembly protein PilB
MDLARSLEAQSGIPSITLEDFSFDPDVVNLLSENFIRSNRIIPLKRYNDTVEVACVPPINPRTLEDVKLITGLKVKPFIVTDEEFDRALNKAFDIEKKARNVIDAVGRREEENVIRVISESIGETSVVSLANSIISDAIRQNASDIHIDPENYSTKVKYRIDGIMYDIISLPKDIAESHVSLIKVNAGMDIAERRRSQDGHFTAKHEDDF